MNLKRTLAPPAPAEAHATRQRQSAPIRRAVAAARVDPVAFLARGAGDVDRVVVEEPVVEFDLAPAQRLRVLVDETRALAAGLLLPVGGSGDAAVNEWMLIVASDGRYGFVAAARVSCSGGDAPARAVTEALAVRE